LNVLATYFGLKPERFALQRIVRKGSRWVRVLGIGIFVVALIGAITLLVAGRDEESIDKAVTFSDGTAITLKAVTYGNEHRYLRGDLKQRLILLLPKKLRQKYASRSVLLSSRGALVFWLERKGPGPPRGDPQLVLCDRSGFGVCGGWSMMRLGPKGNSIEGWLHEYWPRRERTFTLRIYEPGTRYPDATLVGEFKIRNPAFRKYPVWDAPSPPVSAHQEDVTVTLVDLVSGVGRGSNKWKPARNPTVSTTRAGFRVERYGQPAPEWYIASVEARDGTGNVIFDARSTSSERGLAYTELQPHLWPVETGWKLRVGFSQASNFVASELWTLRGLPLDGRSITNMIAFTNGAGVVLRYLGQARHRSFKEDHHFNFGVIPERNDYRVTLVSAVDEQGKPAKGEPSFESSREWTFARDASTNATSMDLTVALHRTRYFDFLVRPQVVSTNFGDK
jgi:hypothetical protein